MWAIRINADAVMLRKSRSVAILGTEYQTRHIWISFLRRRIAFVVLEIRSWHAFLTMRNAYVRLARGLHVPLLGWWDANCLHDRPKWFIDSVALVSHVARGSVLLVTTDLLNCFNASRLHTLLLLSRLFDFLLDVVLFFNILFFVLDFSAHLIHVLAHCCSLLLAGSSIVRWISTAAIARLT